MKYNIPITEQRTKQYNTIYHQLIQLDISNCLYEEANYRESPKPDLLNKRSRTN